MLGGESYKLPAVSFQHVMPATRSLRVILAFAFLLNLVWANLFAFAPETVARLYGALLLDGMHAYLALSRAAAFLLLAVLALLALLRPVRFRAMTLVLGIAYFCFFLVDVIVLARGQMTFGALLPEMAAFLVLAIGLIRFVSFHDDTAAAKRWVAQTGPSAGAAPLEGKEHHE